jgi:lipopolysaccharide/colanic/teichoic acid biosynthesis glycosyltransferase
MAVEPASATQQRAEWTTRPRGRRVEPPAARGSHCISELLFHDVLLRERKRADRSQLPLVLLIVTINNDGAQHHDSAMWGSALDAATSATRETDIVGWLQTDAVLGIVLTEVKTAELGPIQHVRRRIRRELLKRLPVEQMDRFSLRSYVYPDPAAATTEGASVEPLLEGITVRKAGITVYDIAKRTMDLLASTVLLAALSPLMLLIAALIKLKSKGPVLFKQLRVGQRAQPFHMLKFRSMLVNNDDRIHQAFVSDLIKAATPASGVFKIVDDPRVTPIGRFLRKTSLDELPQLWNVVRGEMSLVGPRPPLPYEVRQYKTWHRRRVLEAKPGITGLWQVKGRSRTTFDEMVRLDLRYARTRSFWMDVKILLATPAAVISGKGAA